MIDYLAIAREAKERRFCHQDIDELVCLLKLLVKEAPKIYMEIGTYYGGGMWAVRQVLPKALLVGVDNYSLDTTVNSIEWVDKQGITMPYAIFNADSQQAETLETVREYFSHARDQPVDFLFIDGNHAYDYVSTDFHLYSSLVRKGGTIAFHDINPPDDAKNVRDLWKELKDNYGSQEISLAKSWGGVGLLTWL